MEALKAVVDDRTDLILLDYMMPELNGIETIFRIRSSPEGKTMPIVVASAISEKTLEKKTLSAGRINSFKNRSIQKRSKIYSQNSSNNP
jgi:CheY-like chemotaxis protein